MKKLNVLVVEDTLIAKKVCMLVLSQLHCSVEEASSGTDALNLIIENKYDLIFIDIGLPDMNGLTLAESIRHTANINSKTPLVILTAHTDVNYKNQASRLGMTDFVVKPLLAEKAEELLMKLRAK